MRESRVYIHYECLYILAAGRDLSYTTCLYILAAAGRVQPYIYLHQHSVVVGTYIYIVGHRPFCQGPGREGKHIERGWWMYVYVRRQLHHIIIPLPDIILLTSLTCPTKKKRPKDQRTQERPTYLYVLAYLHPSVCAMMGGPISTSI